MKTTLPILLLTAVAVVFAGCTLLKRDTGEQDGSPGRMMNSDIVPLVGEQNPYPENRPMPLPVEPSPFEMTSGRPAAMQSDLEPRTSSRKTGEPRPLPEEPIP